MSLQIKSLVSGGIMTNYKCSVRCAHCRHKASPGRNHGFISEEMLDKTLHQLENLNCHSVHIEGGEPFLFPDELLRAVKQINKSRVFLEHIVTNCSWYRNKKDTKKLLGLLQKNGLRRLLLKVGPFQNEAIPLRKVDNVAQVANELGINVMIWDNEFYPEVAAFDKTKTHTLKKYIKKYGDDYIKRLAKRFNVTFCGRSFDAYEKHLKKYSVEEILAQNQNSCTYDFPTHTHFHADLYGNFIFSHTEGVAVQIDDLDKPLSPQKYPFLHILYNGGVRSLFNLTTRKYGFIPEAKYLSKCHLCYEMRKFLVVDRAVNSPDLQPRDFYYDN